MKKTFPKKKLGETCEFVRGPFGGSLKKDCFKPEGIAVYEQQHAIYNQFNEIRYFIDNNKFEEMKRFELKAGDLIMSCSGTMGKVAIVPEGVRKGIINQALLKLTPRSNLDAEYLKYWMDSNDFQDSLAKVTVGAAIKNVASVKILKQIELPLPNIELQKQIIAILDEAFNAIDHAIANIEKNIENAKELFQSKLNEIFSQKGVGWEEKNLGEVCEMIKRGIAPKYIEEGGLIVINQKCIRHHKINLKRARNHNQQLKEVNPERFIKLGDVLINSTGTGTLGRVAQVRNKAHQGCTVDTHVTIVRPREGLFFNDFFGYALIKIEKEITEGGEGASGQTELSRHKLEQKFKICYPIDHNMQKQYVIQLDLLKEHSFKIQEKYFKKLENLLELKKSILQKAFTGELTNQMVKV